jgi:hypothetical protein
VGRVFDTAILPIVGFLFLPWTTMMYVLVFPRAVGLDWLGWASPCWPTRIAVRRTMRGRSQMQGYQTPPPQPPMTPP